MSRGSWPISSASRSSSAPTTARVFHSSVASPQPNRPGCVGLDADENPVAHFRVADARLDRRDFHSTLGLPFYSALMYDLFQDKYPVSSSTAGGYVSARLDADWRIDMADKTDREPARDPQDLERLLIARQWAGDVDGMVALFDPNAVVDTGDGRLTHGSGSDPGVVRRRRRDGSKIRVGQAESGARQRRPGAHVDASRRRQRNRRGRPPAKRRNLAMGHRSILRDLARCGALRLRSEGRFTFLHREWAASIGESAQGAKSGNRPLRLACLSLNGSGGCS